MPQRMTKQHTPQTRQHNTPAQRSTLLVSVRNSTKSIWCGVPCKHLELEPINTLPIAGHMH
jgi:hypothetical protein